MSIEENKAVVLRFNKEVIEGKNVQIMDEIFDPEFVNRTARPGFPTGAEGMRQTLSDFLWKTFSDLKIEILDQIGEGDKVTTRKIIHGTHTGEFLGKPATGKRIGIPIIDIVRLRNGKYLEHWNIIDIYNVLLQISS